MLKKTIILNETVISIENLKSAPKLVKLIIDIFIMKEDTSGSTLYSDHFF